MEKGKNNLHTVWNSKIIGKTVDNDLARYVALSKKEISNGEYAKRK
jgi:hypothetical protein